MPLDAPKKETPENLIQNVVTACGSCEDCRHFIEEACLFLPELFRLHDCKREHGESATKDELKRLSDLCNLCGLCPCANIRREIMTAKAAYAERDGLPFSVRALQDVGRIGKLCGAFPRLSNMMVGNPLSSSLIKQALGIHPDRTMPAVPRDNFDNWVLKRSARVGLNTDHQARKAVYFPGCTARFLFPEVARAAVEVLEAFGVHVVSSVHDPEGECCGMPPLLEGDRNMALKLVSRNLQWMAEHVAEGFDVVCSCPTCGYFFKHLLRDGAYYSEAYQQQAGADPTTLRIPVGMGVNGPREGDMVVLHRATYGPILKDKDKQIVLNVERTQYWLDKGAIPSETVSDILVKAGIKHKFAEQKAVRAAKARAIARKKGKPFNEAERAAIKKAAEEAEAKAAAEANESAPEAESAE